MNSLTNHEIAILAEILHYEAINGSLIQKSQIVKNLEGKGFNPVTTTVKILELEKSKKLISTESIDFNSFGYFLTNEGEMYVVNNAEKFDTNENIPF